MKYSTIQTEDNQSLGLLEEQSNDGFRWFGMNLLMGIFAVHFVIVFLGLYLAAFYAVIPGYEVLAKLILFVVPGVSVLLGLMELIFIMVLVWELKTSNHIEVVLFQMYYRSYEEDFEDKGFVRLMKKEKAVDSSFPVRQCMEFIEQSGNIRCEQEKYEYETVSMAFAGGKMTYKEFRQRVALIALRLGYKGIQQ